MTPAAEYLRQQTAGHHAIAESRLLPLLENITTRQQYAHLLRMLYGFYAPVEEAICFHLNENDVPDIGERRNSSLILDDLQALSGFQNSILFCNDLPLIDNKASAFGALYVLEGSTLGGRVILKMLLKNRTLNLSDNEVRFFGGYGEQTGSMWKSFIAQLNEQEDHEAMTTAANQTFTCLSNWIEISH
jgi:heme oxygenase (biliverdin-IX-beta and delta-forming)